MTHIARLERKWKWTAEIVPSVKIVEKWDISGNLEFVNDNKTNVNGCLLQKLKEPNGQWAGTGGEMQWLNFVIFF